MQFEYIKEAIFARAAIIVEGDSEFGAFPFFARLLKIDFDKNGIALLKANGADSIKPIIELFSKLGIKSVGVIDKDKKKNKEKNSMYSDCLFFTKTKCFDSEVIRQVISNRTFSTLKKILLEYDSKGVDREISKKKLQDTIFKYDLKCINVDKGYKFCDVSEKDNIYEVMYISWFEINKGIVLGKIIGKNLSIKEIPSCYLRAIRKVDEYARNI